MAKSVVGKIWKFDATGQYEGKANAAEATPPILDIPIWVDWIQYESGATGGTYEVRESNNGRPIHGPITLGANEALQLAVGGTLQGVYIQLFGSDGQILIKVGQD